MFANKKWLWLPLVLVTGQGVFAQGEQEILDQLTEETTKIQRLQTMVTIFPDRANEKLFEEPLKKIQALRTVLAQLPNPSDAAKKMEKKLAQMFPKPKSPISQQQLSTKLSSSAARTPALPTEDLLTTTKDPLSPARLQTTLTDAGKRQLQKVGTAEDAKITWQRDLKEIFPDVKKTSTVASDPTGHSFSQGSSSPGPSDSDKDAPAMQFPRSKPYEISSEFEGVLGSTSGYDPARRIIAMLENNLKPAGIKVAIVQHVKYSSLDESIKNRVLEFAQRQSWYNTPVTEFKRLDPHLTAIQNMIAEIIYNKQIQRQRDTLVEKQLNEQPVFSRKLADTNQQAQEATKRRRALEKATQDRVSSHNSDSTTPRRSLSRPPASKIPKPPRPSW